MKQRKPTQRTVTLAVGAACAFLVLAALNVAEALRGERSHFLTAGAFAVAAFLWWIVAIRWKRVLDAG